MARSKSFPELVQRNVKQDAAFAEALLREGIGALLSGDIAAGKSIIGEYIEATVGFEKLGAATDAPPESLIRMFGPRGRLEARSLFNVIRYLQKHAGIRPPPRRSCAKPLASSPRTAPALPLPLLRAGRSHLASHGANAPSPPSGGEGRGEGAPPRVVTRDLLC
jgi:hypothetical protein